MNAFATDAGSPARPRTPADGGTVDELSRSECVALLRTADVGRVVYTNGALPAVTPVNFVFDTDRVVIRTAADTQLARKLPGAIVAFEVDELERAARSGWSVVVTGPCQQVSDTARKAEIEALPLEPWIAGEKPVMLEITATVVTGRRINPSVPAQQHSGEPAAE